MIVLIPKGIAEQTGWQRDQPCDDEIIGYLRGGKAELLAENHGHDRPDHTAQMRDHRAKGQRVYFAAEPPILIKKSVYFSHERFLYHNRRVFFQLR